eukprot:Skav215943  [mRNA]  locus=scaffold226:676996:684671:+ [translate_table: standard]
MARYEAHRVRNLVVATAQARGPQLLLLLPGLTEQLSAAARAAADVCQHKGYDVPGQVAPVAPVALLARMSQPQMEICGSKGAALAVGEVARRLPGDVELRVSAAGFAAAEEGSSLNAIGPATYRRRIAETAQRQEAEHLGVSAAQAATESSLGRKVAGSSADEVRSLIRDATSNFTVASMNVKDAQLAGVEIGGGVGMAVLFVALTACMGIFLAKGRRRGHAMVLGVPPGSSQEFRGISMSCWEAPDMHFFPPCHFQLAIQRSCTSKEAGSEEETPLVKGKEQVHELKTNISHDQPTMGITWNPWEPALAPQRVCPGVSFDC